ncbi:hypothetical protein LEMLEM_LOCUS6612, partial [Lemmus lemmus]
MVPQRPGVLCPCETGETLPLSGKCPGITVTSVISALFRALLSPVLQDSQAPDDPVT